VTGQAALPLDGRPVWSPVGQKLDDDWWTFHCAHPDVLADLERMARQAHTRGQTRIGIATLWEALRWRHVTDTVAPAYQLNNNYRSRYARLILDRNPDLAGLFQLRRCRGIAA
jgi:hypothetical protein